MEVDWWTKLDRDTWRPKVFGGSPTSVASVNHGTYFYHASQEGLLANDTNIHAGIRYDFLKVNYVSVQLTHD